MKYILFALALGLAAALPAQTLTYPYNPDADMNQLIGIADVLELLEDYSDAFSPNEILVGNIPLSQFLQDIVAQLPPDGEHEGDLLRWDGSGWTLYRPCLHLPYNGYVYSLVEIGDQCWFAENLQTRLYRDGSSIEAPYTTTQPGSFMEPGHMPFVDSLLYARERGMLYSYGAAVDSRGLCPSGFRVATDGDWMELESHLGMTAYELTQNGFRGSGPWDYASGTWSVGLDGKIKDIGAWIHSSDAALTGATGFAALPAGRMEYYYTSYAGSQYNPSGDPCCTSSLFGGLTPQTEATWWAVGTAPDPFGFSSGLARRLSQTDTGISRETRSFGNLLSVRCVREY